MYGGGQDNGWGHCNQLNKRGTARGRGAESCGNQSTGGQHMMQQHNERGGTSSRQEAEAQENGSRRRKRSVCVTETSVGNGCLQY